jgi:hypothetical protein
VFAEALVITMTGQINERPSGGTGNARSAGLRRNINIVRTASFPLPTIKQWYLRSASLFHLTLVRTVGMVALTTTGVSYSEFVTFGAACNLIGRKNADTLTSLLMIVGIAGLTFLFNDAIPPLCS